MGISTIIGAAIGVAAGWTIGHFGSKVKTDTPCWGATSNPWSGAIFGGIFGLFIGAMVGA